MEAARSEGRLHSTLPFMGEHKSPSYLSWLVSEFGLLVPDGISHS